MKIGSAKLPLLAILYFLSFQVLVAQTKNIYTTSVIDNQKYERDRDTVGLFLNRTQTLPNYFRGSFLYVHDELQDQLDELIVNAPLPQKTTRDWSVLEEYIATEARIWAKLSEINLIAEKAKVPGKAFSRPHQLLSDWHLRSKYHGLAKSYAANEKYSGENWNNFKPIYENALAALETELRVRGFFPESIKLNNGFEQLLNRRFDLVEEFNGVARQEVMNFVDAFPLLIENRARMAEIATEIDGIDEKLGIESGKRPRNRELLTEETVLFRLETLEHGKRSAEMKHHVMRHLDSEVQLLIVKIDEQLAEEKKWLYMEKNHQVIDKGYSTRGPPPGDLPTLVFEETPFPRRPLPGGSTLSDFIDEAKAASISKNKQKVFERTVRQWTERYKALNFNSPRWATYEFHVKPAQSLEFNSLESFLKNQAKCYFECVPASPVEAIKHKAIFETIANEVFGKEKAPKMAALITERPVELIQYQHNLETRIAMHGIYAGTGEELALKELNTHIKEILNGDKIPIKPEAKMGGIRSRPPPSFEDLILKIYEAEAASLKEIAAQQGRIASPPSIEIRLKEIEKIRTTNKMATALHGYQQFIKKSSLYEIGKYFNPESELVKKFELDRQTWATELDNIFRKANYSGSTELPVDLYEKAQNAQHALTAGKKAVQAKLPSRPPQDFEKYQAMTLQRTPGGIWLSPRRFQLKPKGEFEFTWTVVENHRLYPSKDSFYYAEWPIDSLGAKKIRFLKNDTQPNAQHWLNQIHPW